MFFSSSHHCCFLGTFVFHGVDVGSLATHIPSEPIAIIVSPAPTDSITLFYSGLNLNFVPPSLSFSPSVTSQSFTVESTSNTVGTSLVRII